MSEMTFGRTVGLHYFEFGQTPCYPVLTYIIFSWIYMYFSSHYLLSLIPTIMISMYMYVCFQFSLVPIVICTWKTREIKSFLEKLFLWKCLETRNWRLKAWLSKLNPWLCCSRRYLYLPPPPWRVTCIFVWTPTTPLEIPVKHHTFH